MNHEHDHPEASPSGNSRWSRLIRKVLDFAQDSNPSIKVESGWKVYTGEGRGIAAGNEWITNIDVSQLLQSRKMHASIQATLDVDRDSSVTFANRSQAIVQRYQELLDSPAEVDVAASDFPTDQHAQG